MSKSVVMAVLGVLASVVKSEGDEAQQAMEQGVKDLTTRYGLDTATQTNLRAVLTPIAESGAAEIDLTESPILEPKPGMDTTVEENVSKYGKMGPVVIGGPAIGSSPPKRGIVIGGAPTSEEVTGRPVGSVEEELEEEQQRHYNDELTQGPDDGEDDTPEPEEEPKPTTRRSRATANKPRGRR